MYISLSGQVPASPSPLGFSCACLSFPESHAPGYVHPFPHEKADGAHIPVFTGTSISDYLPECFPELGVLRGFLSPASEIRAFPVHALRAGHCLHGRSVHLTCRQHVRECAAAPGMETAVARFRHTLPCPSDHIRDQHHSPGCHKIRKNLGNLCRRKIKFRISRAYFRYNTSVIFFSLLTDLCVLSLSSHVCCPLPCFFLFHANKGIA